MKHGSKSNPSKIDDVATRACGLHLDRRGALSAGAGALYSAARVVEAGVMRGITSGGLVGVASGLATEAQAIDAAPGQTPFSRQTLKSLAEALSRAPFRKPTFDLPPALKNLTYDQYRDIRFRPEKAIWKGEGLGYELQLFSAGFLYDVPVDVSLVDNGLARPIMASPDMFKFGPLIGDVPADAKMAFSGFRIHGPLNNDTYMDEYAVFQGASYFRVVARGQVYGLSSRGLAINTARPEGEEFPFFRAFWIEKPKAGAKHIVVHALLDSESVAAAYTFTVAPGDTADMDVTATFYPRRNLAHVGIAPLTSMYLHGPAQDRLSPDFRPSVHDSEGLAILNAAGEHLWRPLTNPRTLQVSSFVDNGPKGFGLSQRDRAFANYEDLEARYERRPTAWIEPKGNWGRGFVELVEIPATEEIHDNIVAYWKPQGGIPAGKPHELSYRMCWGDVTAASAANVARVLKTRVGVGPREGTYRVIVDYSGNTLGKSETLPRPDISSYGATTSNLTIQSNPETKGVRVSFVLDPGDKDLAELRLGLNQNNKVISEVWLYRWTRS